MKLRVIGENWRNRFGREKVEGYQKYMGANYYLTKYCVKDLCDWDLRINKTKSHKLIFLKINLEMQLSPTKKQLSGLK